MRCTIFAFVVLAIFITTPAFTQVKQWTDKNGVVHFEAAGRPGAKNTNSPQTKTNALRPIDRNFATLRLGDDESTFTAAKKGVQVANTGDDGNFYSYSSALPEGAINMAVLFTTGRLALIMIEYRDFGSAGWDQLVNETSKKYGQALGDSRTAVWHDGTTLLSLQHQLSGNITVRLEDVAAMAKYSEQERAALPKF
jgi:hypothetical protein